jgi:RNA polymerase sigma-70 factor (ECF subfamily)
MQNPAKIFVRTKLAAQQEWYVAFDFSCLDSSGMADETLYATFAPLVAGICWRILGHRADAEEAMQDAFLQAFELSRKEPVRNWPGLLRRLATTSALAKLRGRRHFATSDESELISRDQSPLEQMERQELREKLRNAVAKLPPRDAEVFCLRYLESLNHEEIVQALDIPYASVTSALYRARKRLEAEFADLKVEDRQ